MERQKISKLGAWLFAVLGSLFVVSSVLGRGEEAPLQPAPVVQAIPAQHGWQVLGGSRGWQGDGRGGSYRPPVATPVYPDQNRPMRSDNPWAVESRVKKEPPSTAHRPWGGVPQRDEQSEERKPRAQAYEPPAPAQQPVYGYYGYPGASYWGNSGYGYGGYPYPDSGWSAPYTGSGWSPWGGSGNGFPWGGNFGNWPFVDFY